MSARNSHKKCNIHMASIAGLLIVLAASVHKVRPDDIDLPRSDCNIESLLQSLLMPDEYYAPSLQVQALREDLLRLIHAKENPEYDLMDDDGLLLSESQYDPDKRSLPSLVRSGQIPKRNIGSLMRSGFYGPMQPDGKRSIATLAKNGQLPTLQSPEEEVEEEKRNLASLARSGLLQSSKRSMESLARNGYLQGKRYEDKRNLASIARSGHFNFADKRYLDGLTEGAYYKRNLASVARDGYFGFRQNPYDAESEKRNVQSLMKNGLPTSSTGKRNLASVMRSNYPLIHYEGKRNIGSLARDWSLPNHSGVLDQGPDGNAQSYDGKRNLASLKAREIRSKRNIFKADTDEYPLPVMQNSNGFEYEKLLADLADLYEPEQKRFLGNIPQQRLADLGRISMTQKLEKPTQSTPTYRRRQYLLTRNKENQNAEDSQ